MADRDHNAAQNVLDQARNGWGAAFGEQEGIAARIEPRSRRLQTAESSPRTVRMDPAHPVHASPKPRYLRQEQGRRGDQHADGGQPITVVSEFQVSRLHQAVAGGTHAPVVARLRT